MNLDQAVRLRALWNGSFDLNLQIKEEKASDCSLYILKSQLTIASLEILVRLTESLNLQLKEAPHEYQITTIPL